MSKIVNATYGMIKPYSEDKYENDAVQEIILNEVNKKLKELGLEATVMHEIQYDDKHIGKHYYEHVGRPYYPKLADCLLKNTAIGMAITDKDNSPAVVDTFRNVAGSTVKANKETGEVIRVHEPGSIRYNVAFTLYQIKNGVKPENVVIPENIDDCKLVFDAKNERVDILKDGIKICEMFMTQNFIHSSSSIEDAQNEIETFLDQHEVNKQARLDALKSHAKYKALKNSKPTM